jgi:TRAP-type C4-dicarboxylate transport system substrate-binding protein
LHKLTRKEEIKMRNWKLGSLILCLAVVGFSYFNSSAFGQATPVKLNYSHHFPAPHIINVVAKEWAQEIEKRTNGKVMITVFPGATLIPPDKCFDGVVKGIADIGMAVPAFTRGRFPLTEVLDLPLGYKSAVAPTQLTNDYFNKFKPKEFDEVQIMYSFGHGPAVLHSKKAVNKFEDFKGLRIRCTGLAAKIVAAIGGAPVAMPVSEAYDALSRGIVDASIAAMEAVEGWRWGEVIKFTIESPGFGYTTTFVVVMNKEKWNALPPDTQKIIREVNEEWIKKTGIRWDAIDDSGKNFTLKLGNKVISLPKEENGKIQKAVQPLLDEYVKSAKGRGLPGDEALSFCLDRLKKLQ